MSNADTVALAGNIALERVKSDIVTGTLDKLNSPGKSKKNKSAMEQTYDFNQKVLSSYYEGKGTILDVQQGSPVAGNVGGATTTSTGTVPGQSLISSLLSGE